MLKFANSIHVPKRILLLTEIINLQIDKGSGKYLLEAATQLEKDSEDLKKLLKDLSGLLNSVDSTAFSTLIRELKDQLGRIEKIDFSNYSDEFSYSQLQSMNNSNTPLPTSLAPEAAFVDKIYNGLKDAIISIGAWVEENPAFSVGEKGILIRPEFSQLKDPNVVPTLEMLAKGPEGLFEYIGKSEDEAKEHLIPIYDANAIKNLDNIDKEYEKVVNAWSKLRDTASATYDEIKGKLLKNETSTGTQPSGGFWSAMKNMFSSSKNNQDTEVDDSIITSILGNQPSNAGGTGIFALTFENFQKLVTGLINMTKGVEAVTSSVRNSMSTAVAEPSEDQVSIAQSLQSLGMNSEDQINVASAFEEVGGDPAKPENVDNEKLRSTLEELGYEEEQINAIILKMTGREDAEIELPTEIIDANEEIEQGIDDLENLPSNIEQRPEALLDIEQQLEELEDDTIDIDHEEIIDSAPSVSEIQKKAFDAYKRYEGQVEQLQLHPSKTFAWEEQEDTLKYLEHFEIDLQKSRINQIEKAQVPFEKLMTLFFAEDSKYFITNTKIKELSFKLKSIENKLSFPSSYEDKELEIALSEYEDTIRDFRNALQELPNIYKTLALELQKLIDEPTSNSIHPDTEVTKEFVLGNIFRREMEELYSKILKLIENGPHVIRAIGREWSKNKLDWDNASDSDLEEYVKTNWVEPYEDMPRYIEKTLLPFFEDRKPEEKWLYGKDQDEFPEVFIDLQYGATLEAAEEASKQKGDDIKSSEPKTFRKNEFASELEKMNIGKAQAPYLMQALQNLELAKFENNIRLSDLLEEGIIDDIIDDIKNQKSSKKNKSKVQQVKYKIISRLEDNKDGISDYLESEFEDKEQNQAESSTSHELENTLMERWQALAGIIKD